MGDCGLDCCQSWLSRYLKQGSIPAPIKKIWKEFFGGNKYTCLLSFFVNGSNVSFHVIGIDIDVYSAFAVIFNILCLEVVYDSMRLFYWYLHYIYDLILDLCIIYYTVCYLTGIFYAVVRQISTLFIDNKIDVFCIL